jgi:hypothetical protein
LFAIPVALQQAADDGVRHIAAADKSDVHRGVKREK